MRKPMTKGHIRARIQALLQRAKAAGWESQSWPATNLTIGNQEHRRLKSWSQNRTSIFVYEQANEIMHRVDLLPGENEDFTSSVRDNLGDPDTRVILFDVPRKGPRNGQVHFAVAVYEIGGYIRTSPCAVFERRKEA